MSAAACRRDLESTFDCFKYSLKDTQHPVEPQNRQTFRTQRSAVESNRSEQASTSLGRNRKTMNQISTHQRRKFSSWGCEGQDIPQADIESMHKRVAQRLAMRDFKILTDPHRGRNRNPCAAHYLASLACRYLHDGKMGPRSSHLRGELSRSHHDLQGTISKPAGCRGLRQPFHPPTRRIHAVRPRAVALIDGRNRT